MTTWVSDDWPSGLATRTNARLLAEQGLDLGGRKTVDEAIEILREAGVQAPLEEYNFVLLSDESFKRIVTDPLGRDATASYGKVPPGTRLVQFDGNIKVGGKIDVYVREGVFDSNEAIVQTLSHEIYEIEELRYLAERPISLGRYSDLVNDGKYDNLHYHAVRESDDRLLAYRKLKGIKGPRE